jgi:hypothetical protein
MNDTSWKAFCDFAAHPTRHLDPREPWEVVTSKRKPKQTRQRKVTLSRALQQAAKAGVSVSSATLKPDGVVLQIGETPEQPNPWDSVQ